MTLFTWGHYPLAMILATQVSAIASAILFYRLLLTQKLVISPMWTTILFCFFPARWLISHTIGATEPLSMCFVFAAFLAYYSNRNWLVILFIILATLTRITGLLLIPAFALIYAFDRRWREILLLPICLVGILGLFLWYQHAFGDFFAYFRWNADKVKFVRWPPLEIYRLYASKINFHSTSMYYMLYVIYGIGLLAISKRRSIFIYCLVNYIFVLFIYDFGLHRHLLAIAPFCLFLPFDQLLNRMAFKFILFPFFLYLTYVNAIGWIPIPLMEPDKYQLLLKALAGH
jgi:Gpi18-like mannosyltransferase